MAINAHKIKQEICAIGERIYKKGFAAAAKEYSLYRLISAGS